MTSQLRQASIDRFVPDRPSIPDFIDEFVARHEIAVTTCKRHQNLEDHGFRSLLDTFAAQDALGRQDLPVPDDKPFSQFLICRHRIRLDSRKAFEARNGTLFAGIGVILVTL